MFKDKSKDLGWTVSCKKCGNQIGFVKTKDGRNMPCDPEFVRAADEGPHAQIFTEEGVLLRKPQADDCGYIPHWATCPFAEDFKKEARSRPRQ